MRLHVQPPPAYARLHGASVQLHGALEELVRAAHIAERPDGFRLPHEIGAAKQLRIALMRLVEAPVMLMIVALAQFLERVADRSRSVGRRSARLRAGRKRERRTSRDNAGALRDRASSGVSRKRRLARVDLPLQQRELHEYDFQLVVVRVLGKRRLAVLVRRSTRARARRVASGAPRPRDRRRTPARRRSVRLQTGRRRLRRAAHARLQAIHPL